MKASSKRIISILLSLVLLIMAIFIYGSLIKSAYEKIQEQRSEVVSRRILREENEAAISQVQQLIQGQKSLSQLQEVLSLTMPIGKDMPFLIAQLSGIARSADLIIDSLNFSDLPFRPSVAPLAKEVGIVQIQARATGSYEGIKRFLSNLETNVRLIDIESARIEPAGQSAPNRFNLTVVANTYYQPMGR